MAWPYSHRIIGWHADGHHRQGPLEPRLVAGAENLQLVVAEVHPAADVDDFGILVTARSGANARDHGPWPTRRWSRSCVPRRLVPERPDQHARVVLVPLHHAAHAVEVDLGPGKRRASRRTRATRRLRAGAAVRPSGRCRRATTDPGLRHSSRSSTGARAPRAGSRPRGGRGCTSNSTVRRLPLESPTDSPLTHTSNHESTPSNRSSTRPSSHPSGRENDVRYSPVGLASGTNGGSTGNG